MKIMYTVHGDYTIFPNLFRTDHKIKQKLITLLIGSRLATALLKAGLL